MAEIKLEKIHPDAFEYQKPTDAQLDRMVAVRAAAKLFCNVLEQELPDGPDKTFVMRNLRTTLMWANIAITRLPNGMPRTFT